eukprot:m.20597 g.20597  ORF g.20597 m.20597 type:complete len:114 (+) comp6893_c0_seq1:142-483(+)
MKVTLKPVNVQGTWTVIELQGVIESRDKDPFDGGQLGNLKILEDGTPQLTIGHHQLKGQYVKLKKPFAVLKRQKANGSTSFDILNVIKKKIVFQTRPHSLIAPAYRGLSSILK